MSINGKRSPRAKNKKSTNPRIDKLQEQARLMEQRLANLRGTMEKEKVKRDSLAGAAKPKRARAKRHPSARSRPPSARSETRLKARTPSPSPSPSVATAGDGRAKAKPSRGVTPKSAGNPTPTNPQPEPVRVGTPAKNDYEELSLREHIATNRDQQRPRTSGRPGTSRGGCYVPPMAEKMSAFKQAANWWLATTATTDDDAPMPGSLLKGEYDARAAKTEFQDARKEFLQTQTTDKGDAQTMALLGGSLLDGPDYDEEKNKREFEEARLAWLDQTQDPSPTSAPEAESARPLSAPTNICCYHCYKLVELSAVVTLEQDLVEKLRLSDTEATKFCSDLCKLKFVASSEVLQAKGAANPIKGIVNASGSASEKESGDSNAFPLYPSSPKTTKSPTRELPADQSSVNVAEMNERMQLQNSLVACVEEQGEGMRESENQNDIVLVELPED